MEESPLTNVCRACMTEQGEFQSVFVTDESSGLTIHLAEMIMAYASVQITLGDGLPEQICTSCAEKAVNLYLFKLCCEESDTSFRQRLGKSPLNKMYSITEEMLAAEKLEREAFISRLIKPEVSIEEIKDESDNDFSNIEIVGADDLDTSLEDCTQLESEESETKNETLKQQAFCDICNKGFYRVSHLNRHKKIHLPRKMYHCDICQKTFTRNDILIRHLSTHDGKESNSAYEILKEIKNEDQVASFESILDEENMVETLIEIKAEEEGDNLKCSECYKAFQSKEDLNSHMQLHEIKLKGTPGNYKCPNCNKKFNKPSHLTRHVKIHAEVKPFLCKLCHKGFARSEQLSNHLNAHTGVKPHICGICGKGFNQISNLKDHMRTHNGEKPYLCSVCGKGFNQLGNLRQHTIRHTGVKAHLCSICGNGFASKGELGAHLRKHTGARPFVCSICNHGFTTSSSLTKHKRIHSGEKPYECEVCRMRFSRSGILARHKRTHTGEKPYVCQYCSKAFSQSNDLSSHLRIHTGEKPYICDICGQAFRQSSALKTHKKTHIDRSSILEIERSRNFVPMIHNAFVNVLP